MNLDVTTLNLLNVVVALVTSGVTYLISSHQPSVRGVRGWSIALALCALGWLGLTLPFSARATVMTIPANALVVAGYAVAWLSVRRANHDSIGWQRVVMSVVFSTALFTIVWLAGASTRDAIIMVSLLSGCLALLAAWEIIQGCRAERLRGCYPTALAFAVLGATMLVHAGLSLQVPPLAVRSEFDDPIRGGVLFATTICLIGITLGLLMMSNERLRNRYAKLALTDELTELPNRRSFLEQARRLSRRAAMDRTPACILIMDLDFFSHVNKRFGHAGGDQALVAFASLLRNSVRPADLVGRYGGEEFAAFLTGADLSEGAGIAERIRAALAEHSVEVRGQVLRITVSIGVASLQNGDLQATISSADVALYRAKFLGRNRVATTADDAPAASA